jgi:hypothetical protein
MEQLEPEALAIQNPAPFAGFGESTGAANGPMLQEFAASLRNVLLCNF